jgi:nicotinamidase-related amidase
MRSLMFVAAMAAAWAGSASAQTIIDEWATAKLPAPPALKDVKLVPGETAILAMDFTNQTCSEQRRPRCAASVAKVQKLLTEARAKGALIIFSVAVPNSTSADIVKELTPAAGEAVLPPLGPDKFFNSDLEKLLKDKGIRTVVALGTQAQTSVLHTGATAALRGYKVIVPVDGMSADDPFPEAYTAWHLATAARISAQVTLTKLDAISY